MIDLDTLHETHHGSRFDRMVALLLGIIAVLAAALGLVQMDASMRESRATAGAARLTAELSAGLPVRGVVDTFGAQAVLAAIREMAQGTAQQLVGLGHDDATMQATGAARQAAGERLMTIAGAMSALPTGGLPAYELGLVAADDDPYCPGGAAKEYGVPLGLDTDVIPGGALSTSCGSLPGGTTSITLAGLRSRKITGGRRACR